MSGVVIGYVVSPEGDAAFERALVEVKLRRSSLRVVHALWVQENEDVSEMAGMVDGALRRLEERMRAEGVIGETTLLARSSPVVATLADFVAEVDPDVFVMGLPRRSRVGKLLLGSTAMDLLLRLECPILTVKAPNSERF